MTTSPAAVYRDFAVDRRYHGAVAIDDDSDRAKAKRDADNAVHFFDRLLARGLSRKEAGDITVAYVLGRKVELPELPPKDKLPWE